jgi:hypothetical protein
MALSELVAGAGEQLEQKTAARIRIEIPCITDGDDGHGERYEGKLAHGSLAGLWAIELVAASWHVPPGRAARKAWLDEGGDDSSNRVLDNMVLRRNGGYTVSFA